MMNHLNAHQIVFLAKTNRVLVLIALATIVLRSVMLPSVGALPKAPVTFLAVIVVVSLLMLPWHRWIHSARGLQILLVTTLVSSIGINVSLAWATGTAGWWHFPVALSFWSLALVSLERQAKTAGAMTLSVAQIALVVCFLAYLSALWWLALRGHASATFLAAYALRVVVIGFFMVAVTAICLKAYLHGLSWRQTGDAVGNLLFLTLAAFLTMMVVFRGPIERQSPGIPDQTFFVIAWLVLLAAYVVGKFKLLGLTPAPIIFVAAIVWTTAGAPEHGSAAASTFPLLVVIWLFLMPQRLWWLGLIGSSTYLLRLLAIDGMDRTLLTLFAICGAGVSVWLVWMTRPWLIRDNGSAGVTPTSEVTVQLSASQKLLLLGGFAAVLLTPGAVLIVEQHPSAGLLHTLVMTALLATWAFFAIGRQILGSEVTKRQQQDFNRQTEILSRAQTALQVFDAEGQLVWRNPSSSKLLDLFADEMATANLFGHAQFVNLGLDQLARQVLQSGRQQTLDAQKLDANGHVRYLRYTLDLIESDGLKRILLQTDDQTQVYELRRKADDETRERLEKTQALLELEREQSQILDTASVGLGKVRADRFVWVNDFYAEMLGHSPIELRGSRVEARFADLNELAELLTSLHSISTQHRERTVMECRIRGRSGQIHLHEMVVSSLGDREWVFAARDVSEERERSQALTQTLEQEQAVRGALEALREEQQAILDATVIGLAHARDRRWLWVNQAFAHMLGYEVAELIGRPTKELYVDQQAFEEATSIALAQVQAGRDVIALELHFARKDGTPRLISIRGRMSNMEHFDVIFSYRDITDEREAVKEMETALEAAKAGERAKAEFLSVMSHEIRTPLNGVMGLLQLAQMEKSSSPQMSQLLDSALASSELLLQVLNDVLDASAMDSGRLHLHPVEADFDAFIASIQKVVLALRVPDHVEMRLLLPQQTGKSYLIDELRVKQIVLNLLSNALKFTAEGSVTCELSVLTQDRAPPRLRIRVEDTGIGMNEHQQSRVFEPFIQADMSTRRKYGGSGLGLSIVQGLVERMSGQVSLTSTLGVGSTFVIELPLLEPHEEDDDAGRADEQRFIVHGVQDGLSPTPPEDRSVSTQADDPRQDTAAEVAPAVAGRQTQGELSGLRVLVVEDEPTNRLIHCRMLESAGAQVIAAPTGSKALHELRQQEGHFDVVLMDLQMPDMDGFELVGAIRRESAWLADLPILAVSGNVLNREAERVIEAGMNGFVPKPVRLAKLIDAIRSVLS